MSNKIAAMSRLCCNWIECNARGSKAFYNLKLHGSLGQLVPLGELVRNDEHRRESFIYHKNLQPVTYVIGEVAGSRSSPVYGILNMNERLKKVTTQSGVELAVMSTHMPENSQEYPVKWDGEWHITYEVFRIWARSASLYC